MLFIENTTKGPRTIGLKTGKIVSLLPGNTPISEANHEEIMENPNVVKLFESGILVLIKPEAVTQSSEELTPDEAKREMGEGNDLAQYNAKQAIALVGNTIDITLLRKWKEVETRVGVLKAIDLKIEQIMEPEDKEE